MIPKREKGITLIALIVTVITLIIISGITIGAIKDKKSIFKEAGETGDSLSKESIIEKIEADLYQEKAKTGKLPTKAELKELIKNKGYNNGDLGEDSFVTKDGEYTVEYGEISGWENVIEASKVVTKTEKNNYRDSNGDYATIPAGFTVSGLEDEQIISKGLVIYDIPENELASVNWETASIKYNQFVWIPVASEKAYQRDMSYPSDYDSEMDTTPANSTFTDTGYLPTDIQPTIDNATNNEKAEKAAVLKYNGFYIARYETGFEYENENSNVVSRQDCEALTCKTQERFKTIGKEMYGESSVYVKSAMCSGIQWDMVMKFVDGKTDGIGNTYDVRKFNPNRHIEHVERTGKNVADKVQNIYDLEGNYWENVAEKNNTSALNSCVLRGGFIERDSDYRASMRSAFYGGGDAMFSFRSVLYIK